MKKIAEWWHSYRMIAAILAGVRHIFKLHPYNEAINLASGDRQLTWVRDTISYLELPSLVRKWVIWRHDRMVDFVNSLALENASREDAYTTAWRHYNEHVCGESDVVMKVGETPTSDELYERTKEQTLSQAEIYNQTKNLIQKDKPKGKYEDG